MHRSKQLANPQTSCYERQNLNFKPRFANCEVEHFEAQDDRPLLFYAGRYQRLRAEKVTSALWPQDEFSLFSIGFASKVVRIRMTYHLTPNEF